MISVSKRCFELFCAHAKAVRTSPFLVDERLEDLSTKLPSVYTFIVDSNRGARRQKFMHLFSGATAQRAREREDLDASLVVSNLSESLRFLTLHKCSLDLNILYKTCHRMEQLELSGIKIVDPPLSTLDGLPKWTNLQSLKVFRVQKFTLLHLEGLVSGSAEKLETLEVSWSLKFDDSSQTNSAIGFLKDLPSLKTFHASGCFSKKSYFPYLANYSELTSLDLSFGSGLDGRVLVDCGKLTKLSSLRLDLCSSISEANWIHLNSLSELTSLKVEETSFNENHLKRLKNIQSLEVLQFGRTDSHAALEVCAKTPSVYSLRTLSIPNMPNFSWPSESELETFMNLTTIELGPKGVRNVALHRLKRLPSLTSLTLHTTSPSTEMFLNISEHLSQLYELKIRASGEWSGPPVEEDEISFPPRIRRLSIIGLFPANANFFNSVLSLRENLMQLCLTETRPLSRNFVESIPKMPKLEDLDLVGCELPRAVSIFLLQMCPQSVKIIL